jgi:hypothetical protein
VNLVGCDGEVVEDVRHGRDRRGDLAGLVELAAIDMALR